MYCFQSEDSPMRNPPGKKIASGTETDPSFFFSTPHPPKQQKVSKNEPDEKDISLAFLFLIFL